MKSRRLIFASLLLIILALHANSYCMLGQYKDTNGDCQSCPANCQVCTLNDKNSVDCYACNEYYRVDIDSMRCVACPQNCKQCTSQNGKCTECKENYLYNQDTDRCEVQKRDSNGVVICLKGYFNDEGLCNRCGAFCTECDNYGTCTSCMDGHYLTTYEEHYVSEVQCQLCRYPCKTCTSSSECLTKYDVANDLYEKVSGRGKCKERQFESTQDGSCNACQADCTDCNKYGVCLGCDDGYNLINGTDQYAFPYCKACGPTDQCAQDAIKKAEDKCGVSHFYSSSTDQCISCGYGCLHCTQEGYCVECKSGMYLDKNYEYCSDKPIDYKNCSVGYYKDYGVCTVCKDGCEKCREWDICENCQNGFHLVGRDNSCVNVTDYEAKQNVVKCYARYYKKGNNCEYCGDGCLVCNENMGCMACDNGLTLSNGNCVKSSNQTNGTITLCASHCVSCSAPFTCDVCQKGFYHYSGGCLACNYGCDQCAVGGSCSGGGQQQQEQQGGQYDITCSSNCVSCLSLSTCFVCKEGYTLLNGGCSKTCNSGYFMDSNGNCKSCSSNCLQCTSESFCQTCASSYSLSISGSCYQASISCSTGTYYSSAKNSCQSCPSNCDTCKDSSSCSNCASGYSLSTNGSCYIKSCPPGTYFTGSSCQSCDSQCLECSNGGKCSMCADGYYLKDSECKHCGADCRTCDENQKCTNVNSFETSCPEGQFRNSFNMCFNCPYGCKHCGQTYTCITCKDGYYKNSLGTCSQCIGCSTCSEGGVCPSSTTDDSTAVSPCGHGRYMTTWGSCMNCGWGCDYCDQTGTCKRCQAGYYSSYNFCYKCMYPCATCSSSSQCLTTLSSLDWADQNPKTHLALIIFGIAILSIGVGYLVYSMCIKNKKGSDSLLQEQSIQMTSSQL